MGTPAHPCCVPDLLPPPAVHKTQVGVRRLACPPPIGRRHCSPGTGSKNPALRQFKNKRGAHRLVHPWGNPTNNLFLFSRTII